MQKEKGQSWVRLEAYSAVCHQLGVMDLCCCLETRECLNRCGAPTDRPNMHPWKQLEMPPLASPGAPPLLP